MKKYMMRLCNKKGESLIESMAAILIFTMASIIMLTMVSASADINAKAKDADATHQEQLLIVEKAEGTAEVKQLAISLEQADGTTVTVAVDVELYAAEGDGTLYAYYPKAEVSGE